MSRTVKVILQSLGIGLTAAVLIAAVICGYRMTPTTEPCTSLRIFIEDRAERQYTTEAELTQLLKANDLYPVGRSLAPATLHRIEKTIAHHPMVRTAECYITPRNEVRVRLTQRVPLLRVQAPFDTYLIDTDRRVMEARTVVRDSVLLVTGNVGAQTATKTLADFAQWLQQNEYWRQRIHHIYVQNPQMVYVYLRGANQPRVVVGSVRGYEKKLDKLRVFLENGAQALQGKNYTELDVRFKGQVIGR